MYDAQADESFGLRLCVPSGLVSEIPERYLRAAGDSGTSRENDQGDLRGVRHRDSGNGGHGRPRPSLGYVPAISIDRGGRQNHQKQQRAGIVSRVPKSEKKIVGRGTVGGRIFRPHSRRPSDSGDYREIHRLPSRPRARACAACLEAALLMPRGLPRGYLLWIGSTSTRSEDVGRG